jgi:hypothetical protein
LAKASAQQSACEIVLGGNRTFKPGSAAHCDHVIECFFRGFAQMQQWEGLQRPRAGFVWRAFPIDMIKNIADAADSTPAHPGNTDGAEPVHKNARFAGFVIKAYAAFDKLIVALDYACAHPR